MIKFIVVLSVLFFAISCGTISEKNASWVKQPHIERSPTLPEGLHRWDIGAAYVKNQDYNSSYEFVVPWFFSWSKGLSDKLTINWLLFLPSWTYLLKNTEKVKMSISGGFTGFGYTTSIGTMITISGRWSARYLFTNWFGVNVAAHINALLAKHDSMRSYQLSSGMIFQVTDFWSLAAGIAIATNSDNTIGNYDYEDGDDYYFPLYARSKWNLSKYFDLKFDYLYSGNDLKDRRRSHQVQLMLGYFW